MTHGDSLRAKRPPWRTTISAPSPLTILSSSAATCSTKTLGLRLESFSAGPDSGIDLRHVAPTETLIVQCKHFADSGFAALRRHLERKERPKIQRLRPSRYVLVTSVPLTPKRKDTLFEILHPYCHTAADILGREDVNSLLANQPVVEQRHFKLWLTSTAVLKRVLHSGIFSDSETHLDRVRLRLSRYVPNDSFERAKAILDESHFCIIAGIPGIGKTTLAEVLLADLVDRQGYRAFRITQNLLEVRPIKNVTSKQVFYYDDFLGNTSFDKLEKNEDQRLVELMEEVAANPNWRFHTYNTRVHTQHCQEALRSVRARPDRPHSMRN